MEVLLLLLSVSRLSNASTIEAPDMSVWDNSYDLPWPLGDGQHRPMVVPWEEDTVNKKDICIHGTFSRNFTGYEYVKQIYSACEDAGEACETGFCGERGPFFRHIEKKWDCQKLWGAKILDQPSMDRHPPNWERIPEGVRSHYVYGDPKLVKVTAPHNVYDNKYYGSKALNNDWTIEYIRKMEKQAHAGTIHGAYGVWHGRQLREIIKKFSAVKSKKSALVVGSEKPWVEAILLSVGFETVTTLEYGTIRTFDPRMAAYTPSQFRSRVLAGEYAGDKAFDTVVVYSSVEHSGLGRYGDAINPPGDLVMMARVHCVTKPGGLLFFSAPISGRDDMIHFNGHRVYGPIMLPNLLANWKQVAAPYQFNSTGSASRIIQPVVVLEA